MSSVAHASKLGMGLLLGFSLFSALPARAEAPITDQAPLSTTTPEINSDPFSSRGDNSGAIMQLIHRAMRGDANVDRAAELAAQRESLSDAASDFFAKREQRLKQKNQPEPTDKNLPGQSPIAPVNGVVPVPANSPSPGTTIVQPVAPSPAPANTADLLVIPQP